MARRILVVEDSPTQAELLRLLLEGAGYQVDLAANGREGLERVQSSPPDLIISDVIMPEMDGYAFCQAVKSAETTRRIPFVLLTQRNMPQDILWGLTRGADNFITKPFDDEYLLERVKRIFGHLDLRGKGQLEVDVILRVGEREIVINADKQQIVELLFATFEDVCRLNNELQDARRALEDHATNLEAKVRERTEALRRLNRSLRAISLCNQDLVRAKEEGELLREICRTIVEVGGHRTAWVGLVADGEEQRVRAVAVVGCEPKLVDSHAMDLADPAWETCPVALAIGTGAVQVIQNIPGNPPRCQWHEEAVRLGFGSSVSLPLKKDGRPFGALTIYSALLDAFDAEEVNLLGELANDLAYGIQAIRTRAAHERALAEIESLARFPNENPNPVMRVREDGVILYANAPSEPLLRLWDTAVGDRMPADWIARIRHALETRAQESIDLSCDGRVYSIIMTPIAGGPYVNLYGRDITERKRAEEGLITRTRQLEAIRAVNEEITRELDLRAVLDLIVRRAVDLVRASSAMLRLWQEDTGLLVPQSWLGVGEQRETLTLRLGEGVAGAVAQQRQGLVVNDFRHSPYTTPTLLELTTHTAVLSEPLLYRDRLVGVINLNRDEAGQPFEDQDRQLLALFAAQAAIAIENARLYREEQQRRVQLEAVRTVAAELTRELDLKKVLDLLTRRGAELVGAVSGTVWLWDESEEVLVPRFWHGFGAERGEERRRLGEGVAGTTAQRREGLIVNDYRTSPLAHPLTVGRTPITAVLAEPLLYHDRLLGVVSVDQQEPGHHFTPQDRGVLALFAAHAAIAIENARLYEATVRQLTELKALYDMGQAISSSLSLDEQLRLLAERLSQATGAQRVLVGLMAPGDPDRISLCLAYDASRADPWLRQLDLSPEGYPEIQEAMRMERPLVIPEVVTEPLLAPVRHYLESLNLRSMVVVPLIVQERAIGAISLGFLGRGRSFTNEEVNLLRTFTTQAAIAIEKARLFSAAEQRAAELGTLREIDHAITSRLELPAVLQAVVAGAMQLVGAQHTQLVLWDEASQRLALGAAVGREEERVRAQKFELGKGINATVALTRQPMILDDYQASPYALPEFPDVVATVTVPVLFEDRLLGVLHAHTTQAGKRFTPDDLRRFQTLAAQAAIAIENARLYQQIQQHAAELEDRVQERTRELEAANQQLQDASRHKSEFLANMSHEIRTPLNSIIGFSELLREQGVGPLTERQARYLTHIWNGGKHLVQLIGDILDISKVEAGKFVLQPEPLPVAQTLEDILVIGRGLANKKAQEIQVEIAPDLPSLHADPVRFKQILFNLLSNAVKFTPDKGTIRLTAKQATGIQSMGAEGQGSRGGGEHGSKGVGEPSPLPPGPSAPLPFLEIRVTDTGIGIRPEDLPRLFQEFVQLETTQAQRHEGSGLGLALTRRLVELHGGRIWAASDGEGRGSTFTFVLPFAGPSDKGTE